MIEIKVTSREKARVNCECGADAALMESNTDVQIGGEPQEIKHEFIALLEAFEKHAMLAPIWHEALIEHTADLEKSAK